MGRDTNVVILVGRSVRDCEVKYTTSGLAIANFSIACNDIKKNGNEYIDEVSFFNCTMFGKMAEGVGKYIIKGKQISVTGKLKQDRWTDQGGNNRYAVKIIVNQLQLLGSKGDSKPVASSEMFNTKDASDAQFEEDIPF